MLLATNTSMKNIIYSFETKDEIQDWVIVNDGVMGGLSESQVQWNEKNKTIIFSGNVSLENYGGFASTRTKPKKFDTQNITSVKIRVKGDGLKYKFRLRNSNKFDGMVYNHNFETQKDKWIEVEFQIKDFDASFRGRIYSDYPKLDPQDIRQFGFLIADKQEGEFKLEVDWIKIKG